MRHVATLEDQQAKYDYATIEGSVELLKALWREHRPIMQARWLKGRAQVPLVGPLPPAPKPKRLMNPPSRNPDEPRAMPGVFVNLLHGVAEDLGVSVSAILSPKRDSELTEARSVISNILYRRGWSYTQIGDCMGGRDHSTVKHTTKMLVVYERRNPDVTKSMEKWAHLAERGA